MPKLTIYTLQYYLFYSLYDPRSHIDYRSLHVEHCQHDSVLCILGPYVRYRRPQSSIMPPRVNGMSTRRSGSGCILLPLQFCAGFFPHCHRRYRRAIRQGPGESKSRMASSRNGSAIGPKPRVRSEIGLKTWPCTSRSRAVLAITWALLC